MRTGTWHLSAALALLAVGILSAPAHKPEKRHQETTEHQRVETYAAVGVHTLELDGISKVDLQDVAEIKLVNVSRNASKDERPLASTETSNGVMKIRENKEIGMRHTELTAPASITLVRNQERLSVSARTFLDTLQLESPSIYWWQGDAALLDIHLLPPAMEHPRDNSKFEFKGGKIGLLRIHAPSGTVILHDLSHVQEIELHAGPKTMLQALHTDLPRIRITPLE